MTDDVPLAGFWCGGFDGADPVNARGQALDLADLNDHARRLDEDHARAAAAGLHAVRESIGWRRSEDAAGRIDLGGALAVQASARRHGLQVLWTLVHGGLPAGLALHDAALAGRLARFAAEAARVLAPGEPAPLVLTPVHGIGALAGGDAVLLRHLVRATLAAMHAVRDTAPATRFLHVEPLLHIVAPPGRPELAAPAAQATGRQWDVWDLLAGRQEPALGGAPAWLDLVGVVWHAGAQWELETGRTLDWASRDPRRRPLAALLEEAWRRYRRPLVLAETAHGGARRAAWLHDVAGELRHARRRQVPVAALTLAPLVDRPDPEEPAQWPRCGLWHVDLGQALARHADRDTLGALRAWQAAGIDTPPRPVLLVFTHRRWNQLRERTRHLVERLAGPAGAWHAVVVEEPRLTVDRARLDCVTAGPHLDVLVAYTQDGSPGFTASQRPAMLALLAPWLAARGLRAPPAWLTTPAAWPLARALKVGRVVYDCAEVPEDLEARALEGSLLAAAQVVLCASEPLAAHRAAARPRLLPNGVEHARFRPEARARGGWDDDEAARLTPPGSGPLVGHAGRVDERVDLELLDALAVARPAWRVLVAGPVDHIARTHLPRRPNLHWLGTVPYRVLPALLARWQAAWLPWSAAAARHRSALPTAVAEALAAGVPVVAPPMPALAPWQGHGVHAAQGLADTLAAFDAAFAAPPSTGLAPAVADWDTLAERAAAALQAAPAVA